jgi:hypothetical protein
MEIHAPLARLAIASAFAGGLQEGSEFWEPRQAVFRRLEELPDQESEDLNTEACGRECSGNGFLLPFDQIPQRAL